MVPDHRTPTSDSTPMPTASPTYPPAASPVSHSPGGPGLASSTRRTRVMHITQDLMVGGLERVIVLLCRTLDRERFEPSVLCLRGAGGFAPELVEQGIPVHVLPWSPEKLDYFAFRKVGEVLRERRIDVIHTHNTGPFFHGALGATLAGVKTHIHTDHARPFPDSLRWMVAEHVLSHLAYRVVGVSDDTTHNLRHYEKIPESKLATIPNGIDLQPVRTDPARLRQELGISPATTVIGTAGRLTHQKGMEFLIQAAGLLAPRFPDLTVLIVGEGSEQNALQEMVRSAGLQDRVRLLGLRMDIPDLLALFDIYALPSRWEGLPMAILEAMAASLPIVASAVGGVPTAVREGVNGLLVPPENPVALAGALEKLLDEPQLRKRMGEAGRKRYEAGFTARQMTRRYERLYLRQE
jgi:glycosyltransferase involved in cell wall biosynthesis